MGFPLHVADHVEDTMGLEMEREKYDLAVQRLVTSYLSVHPPSELRPVRLPTSRLHWVFTLYRDI